MVALAGAFAVSRMVQGSMQLSLHGRLARRRSPATALLVEACRVPVQAPEVDRATAPATATVSPGLVPLTRAVLSLR